ncbi:MAG TPA: hypothetical protein VIW80_02830 [Pyrinomonadaceae bacterium]
MGTVSTMRRTLDARVRLRRISRFNPESSRQQLAALVTLGPAPLVRLA